MAMSSTTAPSDDPTAPSGDTDVSDPDVVFDNSSITDVLSRIGLNQASIMAFLEAQDEQNKNMLHLIRTLRQINNIPIFQRRFNMITLIANPDWTEFDTEDLEVLATWFLTKDEGLYESFDWDNELCAIEFRFFRNCPEVRDPPLPKNQSLLAIA